MVAVAALTTQSRPMASLVTKLGLTEQTVPGVFSKGNALSCRAMSDSTVTPPISQDDSIGTSRQDAIGNRKRDLRFVGRIHRMRNLGVALGSVCVGSVLWIHDEPPLVWMLLAAHAFLWPRIAKTLAIRSADPAKAELRHLLLDSALGGMWIALMHFNLLPSVLLLTMLSVDKIAVGGVRLALRTTAVLAAACICTAAAIAFPIEIETQTVVVVGCIPLLVGYPLAISNVMYALSTRVARQNKRLVHLSSTDELTGLANRRQGFAAAGHALARHRRNGGTSVLVVLDIDRFKEINDTYGHPFGDDVLRAIAMMLRRCARATDTPARHGGDEFMLVLSDTNLAGANEAVKRIRQQLALATFEKVPGLRCTGSFGLAEAHEEMIDVEDWIQQADAALYNAKTRGCDCVVSAPSMRSYESYGLALAPSALKVSAESRERTCASA